MSDKILATATAYRSYLFTGARVYRVELDGATCCHIIAADLPQARGLARRALKAAHASPYNRSLVFDGHEEPGYVARSQFRAHLRTICDEQFGAEWVD
jgi:hypothetical protein